MASQPGGVRISSEVSALVAQIVALRRDLHRHPELGFQETRTAGLVAAELEALGLEVRRGVARTGVVGLLRGARPGRTLLIRADMDALPLPEEREVAYRSTVAGVMHACGHDGHVAMALGAARVLAAMRERLAGNVKFCFQPAEEGPGGALPMIRDGVLDNPRVDAAVGIHLWNDLDAGRIGIRGGPIMAAADKFELDVEGVGGHGAYPHDTVDPVLVSAHIITALQSVVSRSLSPLSAGVVTVGMVHAGYKDNIIPRTATMVGTLRAFDPHVRARIATRVQEVATGVAAAFGARARLRIEEGYPPTVNDHAMSAFVTEQAVLVFGKEGVVEPEPSMGAEDMSYYLQEVPGSFLFLGSRNREKGFDAPHHSPFFDFDESVLASGTEIFVQSALAYLA